MARDRQRAKQRQAERRARRQGDGDGVQDPRAVEPSPVVDPDLAVGAPPTVEGRSEYVGREEPDEAELDDVDPELEHDAMEAGALASVDDPDMLGDQPDDGYAPRGRRGDSHAARKAESRPRVVQFMSASWAELQRVQWPDRQALTTLTGVVLGFVIIVGFYLGALDFIFSRLINAIL